MKFIWFCAAGYSFIFGVSLLVLVCLLSIVWKKLYHRLIIYALLIMTSFLILLSATPLPNWFYIIWITSVFGWLLFVILPKISAHRYFKILPFAPLCLSLVALFYELPHYFLIAAKPCQQFEKLYIIGDSVSAGIGGRDELTWPKLLQQKYCINVVDLSESGATIATAISRQACNVNSSNAIVLLEIGGNDLFAPTPYKKFEQELTQLLKIVSNSNRHIIMIELPLLPWQIEYGRIQRKLAKEFTVTLIPKHFFVRILSAKGATKDLAHLSPKGHELMSEMIYSVLKKTSSNTNKS